MRHAWAWRSEQLDADPSIAAGYLRYLDAFLVELDRPAAQATETRLRQAQFASEMTGHMRAVAPLRKLFGGDWIDTYFYMFFTIPPSHPQELYG